ncbi:hypothetical protein [uncultured Tateyamaria sp.]|uniref:hypothetical protein n=1 Tax=uncultured Tateyamaria sp. TaxID=455651 RepID=UPI00262FC34C|nr:hypothetical protein [uncultured Tateyamaria sp.]
MIYINPLQFRSGMVTGAVWFLAATFFVSLLVFTGGEREVHSDIPALKRAFNDPSFGNYISVIFLCGVGAFFGFIHGFMMRPIRQTNLLAASNPKSKGVFFKNVQHSFWDKHVHRLNADGTDMIASTSNDD